MGFRNPKDLPAELRVEQTRDCLTAEETETSVSAEKIFVSDDEATETIRFRNEDWSIFWPRHTRNRTYDRHSHPKAARHSLNFLLKLLDPISDKIWEEFEGEVTLRAFPLKSCFILKVDKEGHNICVVTYGNSIGFNPRYGDTVVTLAENGNVSAMRWQKKESNTDASNKHLLGSVAFRT